MPLLVNYLVAKFAARIRMKSESVGKATMDRLTQYRWPGNIRELENILERAIILSNGPTLEIDPEVFASGLADLRPDTEPRHPLPKSNARRPTPRGQPLQDLESNARNHILTALERSNWSH